MKIPHPSPSALVMLLTFALLGLSVSCIFPERGYGPHRGGGGGYGERGGYPR